MNPEADYKKALLLKIGIIVVIATILFLWLASLRNVFESRQTETDNGLKKISEDLNQSIKEAETRFNTVTSSSTDNAFVKGMIEKASSTKNTATSTAELKKELSNLIKTATTTPKKSNCPPYIDCMPKIGGANACVVPAGCEGITQIAY